MYTGKMWFIWLLAACVCVGAQEFHTHSSHDAPVENGVDVCTDTAKWKHFEYVLSSYAALLAKFEQYDKARDELLVSENYDNHGTDYFMTSVIPKIYQDNSTNVIYCLGLLEKLGCKANDVALDLLLKTMEHYGHTNRPEVLLVSNYLKTRSCSDTAFVKAKEYASSKTEVVLAKWTLDVNNREIPSIVQFVKEGQAQTDIMAQYLPELVTRVFSTNTPDAFNKTVELVLKLPNLRTDISGYTAIANKLKTRGKGHSTEMLFLGYLVSKTIKSHALAIALNPKLLTGFNALVNTISSSIGSIFWKKTCFIRNIQNSDYLLVDQGQNGTGVYTGPEESLVTAASWEILPIAAARNETVLFAIRSKYITAGSQYLCEQKFTKSIILCGRGFVDAWILKPVTYTGATSVFLLTNSNLETNRASYLHATTNLDTVSGFRTVKNSVLSDASYWEITCH